MGVFDELSGGVNRRVAELQGNLVADPRSVDGGDMANQPFTHETDDYDRTEPPKDEMRKYWRQYETTPIVKKPINSFASRVVEPGYYIDRPEDVDDEVIGDLITWLEEAAIIEKDKNRDVYQLLHKAVQQREVRGTVLIEKVPDKNSDKLAALKFINPETVDVVARPDGSLLMQPGDEEIYDDAPTTEDGVAAAYLQDVLETQNEWGISYKGHRGNWENHIPFREDEIIRITRDADIGEAFGTSRVESVSDRIEGLKQKLQDNDEAIASKAYPLWLFLFGTEDNPWNRDDINKFMRAHEVKNFHPGMKQGVRGDVGIETISGEVAEISEYLQFDLDWIISAMPMPKYALGGFTGSAAGIQAQAQQRDVQRQINDARQDIETRFTPVIREKAQELGLSEREASQIAFRIGDPTTVEEPADNVQTIRYQGKNQTADSAGGPDMSTKDQPRPDGRTNRDSQSQQNQPPAEPEGQEAEQ